MFTKIKKKVASIATVLMALQILTVGLFANPVGAFAAGSQSSATKVPNTVVNDNSIGSYPWTISESNSAVAKIESSQNRTNYLKTTKYNFSIPSAAVIDGIELSVEKYQSCASESCTSNAFDNSVKLVKNNSVVGVNKAQPSTWPKTATVANYGSYNDLWGASWTANDINSLNFGVAISTGRTQGGSLNVYVKSVSVKVYYTVPNVAPTAPVLETPADLAYVKPSSTLTWAHSIDGDGDALEYIVSIVGENGFHEEKPAISPLSITGLADGSYQWTVRAWDGESFSPWSETRHFTVDGTMPTVSIDSPSDTHVNKVVNIFASVADSNLVSWKLLISDALGNEVYAPAETPTEVGFTNQLIYAWDTASKIEKVADGTYKIKLTATDKADNQAVVEKDVVVDNTAPTITLNGDNPVTVEAGSIYKDAGVVVSGGALVGEPVSTVDTKKIGEYTVTYTAKDAVGNTETAVRTVKVIDWTKPVLTLVPEKLYINNVEKDFSFKVKSDEKVVINPLAMKFVDENKIEYLQDAIKVALTNPTDYELEKSVTIPAKFFAAGNHKITAELTAEEENGNNVVYPFEIVIDTEAPKGVGGFNGTIDANGNIVLNWTLPADNDYAKLVVKRDGVEVATLLPTAVNYTDTTATKGTSHKYEVVAYDAAGNFASVTPVSLEVPSTVTVAPQVKAAMKDNSKITQAPVTNDDKEVKSESDESKPEEKKDSFPIWGIILLVLLAGVGGYLFLTQKPSEAPVTVRTEPIKPKPNNKKK